MVHREGGDHFPSFLQIKFSLSFPKFDLFKIDLLNAFEDEEFIIIYIVFIHSDSYLYYKVSVDVPSGRLLVHWI